MGSPSFGAYRDGPAAYFQASNIGHALAFWDPGVAKVFPLKICVAPTRLPTGRRWSIARIIEADRNDTIAVLREVGGDTADAVSFGEPSMCESWTYAALETLYGEKTPDKALLKHFEDLKIRPLLIGEDRIRLSLAGGQQETALTVLGPDAPTPRPSRQRRRPRNGAPSNLTSDAEVVDPRQATNLMRAPSIS